MRRGLLALMVSGVFSAQTAAAVPNDFDGDSVSDLTRVEVSGDKQLTWRTALSTTLQTAELGTLGSQGGTPAMAQWLPGGTQVGVVALDASSGSLIWSILDESGAKISRTFGKKGDVILAGADFNGNGIADAAVVRLVKKKAQWQVAYDLFTNPTVQPVTITFGTNGDRVFYARVAGDSADSLGLMRKGAGRRSAARMKNLATGVVKQFTRLPAFASTGDRPRAFPIPQPGSSDLLGFKIAKAKKTEVRVFTMAGVNVGSVAFDGTGDIVVGDFIPGGAYEVAYQSASEAGLFSPVAGEVTEITPASGTLVGVSSITAIGAAASTTPSNGSDGSSGSAGQCSRILSLPGSHIYKSIGSNHFTDVRRNTAGTVIKSGGVGPFPSCVEVLSSNGKVVAKMGLYSKGAGWAARYYAGIGCGAGTAYNGSAIASRARSASGSSSIYLNFGGGVCYGPLEPTRCVHSSSC